MDSLSRKLMILACVLLLGAFVLPIWKIALIAPQYPEGLRMVIYAANITGGQPSDIYNINLLNHYIGMQSINPGSLPELKIIPLFIAFLVLTGFLCALWGKRWMCALWFASMVIGGTTGLVDFYRWEYAYGHNLNPDAPIKLPGMTYQPPLLGTKTLLNITASSYPAIGGYLVFAAAFIGIALMVRLYGKRLLAARAHAIALLLVPLALSLSACTASGPVAIQFGTDVCDNCGMSIVDRQFAAELVTDKGKPYRFDSVTCLASYIKQHSKSLGGAALWVSDYSQPSSLICATKALYLNEVEHSGPMGACLAAFANEGTLKKFQHAGDRVETWSDVMTMENPECVSTRP